MLNEPAVFDAVQIDIQARLAFVRTGDCEKHKVTLPDQKLDLFNGSMLHQVLHILEEVPEPVLHTRFVPDHHIAREDLIVAGSITREMKGLVVLPHESFVCFRAV